MRRIAFLVMGLMALSGPAVVNANFIAYNDFNDASNGTSGNVTEYGPASGSLVHGQTYINSPQALIDHASGAPAGVSLAVNHLNVGYAPHTGPLDYFTQGLAAAEFGTVLNSNDFLKEMNYRTSGYDVWVDFVFSGMSPNKRYTVVVTGNRSSTPGRIGQFTLSSADLFTNTSSPGTFSGPSSATTTFDTGPNDVGNAARFSDIAPGSDGTITVRANPLIQGTAWPGIATASDGRFFVNQIKLVEVPEPATFSLLAVGGLLLCRRRRA